jgi:hypothetical protein
MNFIALGAHVAPPGIAQDDTVALEARGARRDGRVLDPKPPSTLSMSSTTSAWLAKKAPASRMSRKLPQLAETIEGNWIG